MFVSNHAPRRPRCLESVSDLARALALAGSGLLLTSCPSASSGSGSSDSLFSVHSTRQAVAISTPILFSGDYFAYLAAESSGSEGSVDLNGDLDSSDSIVTVQQFVTREQTVLGIAARSLAWVGETLFIEVREDEDNRDWDQDTGKGADEYSLLRWTPGDAEATFVASLEAEADPRMLALRGERLVIVESGGPVGGQGTTSLSVIEAAAPELPLPVTTSSDAAAGLNPRLIGEQEGLVFLLLDEASDGDLNEDADEDDTILALLDGSQAASELQVTARAIADESVPYRASATGTGDWLVGFLVDEEGQGASLNDRDLFGGVWEPEGCPGVDDLDSDDQVLAFLHFADWVADSVGAPIRNTGLVGRGRVFVAGDYVGTIAYEEDDGCDLNGDGDELDRVARWVFAEPDPGTDLEPPGTTDLMLALPEEGDISGPTLGVAELSERLVILVSEELDGRNHDLNLDEDYNLIAWLDPDSATSWEFDHGSSSAFFLGATWMDETSARDYVLIAALEEVSGGNFNIPAGATGPDMDMRDSVPVIARFNTTRLFPGLVPVAVRATNAGLTRIGGYVYGRVHEAADSRDLNQDGDLDDELVFRHELASGSTSIMSVLNNIGGRRAVDSDDTLSSPRGAAFIADERDQSKDFNHDGDKDDFVVRYFRIR